MFRRWQMIVMGVVVVLLLSWLFICETEKKKVWLEMARSPR
jgi:lipopolysaccharide export system protein LptC